MSREELGQFENLERFDAGEGQHFVVIPRYEDSGIFVQPLRWRSMEGRQPAEILHHRQNTPQNYALVITVPLPRIEDQWDEKEVVCVTVVRGEHWARHDFWGGERRDIFFPLTVHYEPFSQRSGFWIGTVFDTPLANNIMLRRATPPCSEANEFSFVLEGGQMIDLNDGRSLVAVSPWVSLEMDMVAVMISRVFMPEYNSLFLFDTNTQVYRELETEGPLGGRVPSWTYWLDDSHLLVGSGWVGRYLIDAHAYVYIVEEDEFFRLFESSFDTQVRWARVEGDKMIVTYAVAVCFGYRSNSYEDRERTFLLSEVWAMINARQSYVFEWDGENLGAC